VYNSQKSEWKLHRLECKALSRLEKEKRKAVTPSIRLMVRLYLSRKLQNEMVITLSISGLLFITYLLTGLLSLACALTNLIVLTASSSLLVLQTVTISWRHWCRVSTHSV